MVNIKRLKVVRDFITANPEKFVMKRFVSDCGTSMCIAGWACSIFDPDFSPKRFVEDEEYGYDVHEQAQNILGLTFTQADNLFGSYMHDPNRALINLNEFIKNEEEKNG